MFEYNRKESSSFVLWYKTSCHKIDRLHENHTSFITPRQLVICNRRVTVTCNILNILYTLGKKAESGNCGFATNQNARTFQAFEMIIFAEK